MTPGPSRSDQRSAAASSICPCVSFTVINGSTCQPLLSLGLCFVLFGQLHVFGSSDSCYRGFRDSGHTLSQRI
ncbi:hypothetical protein GDO78_023152 [Eleutherodactylus coqui]|uniref:Uncharacterized protein n=1 Tax=Eleutherodactylus coqui TaxID=57060 RepID=A0A8J6B290_ELECQ|nr:hypothetical protein GDO78_023152 [Eleutherodactylus coqui]